MARCKACDAEIVWAETANGKKMPVDVEPCLTGNVELVPRAGQPPRAVVHKTTSTQERYMSHFASCPRAKELRRAH